MKVKASVRAGFTLVEIMIVVAIIGMLAAIGIPNYVRARGTAQKTACVNNLHLIDGAKQQWALENHKTDTDTPAETDVKPYLKGNQLPSCPGGGTYAMGAMNTDPTCSKGADGHVLPGASAQAGTQQ